MSNLYPSMTALSKDKGIPVEQLKKYKKMGATGFGIQGRINWEELEKWIEDNAHQIKDLDDDLYFKYRGIRMEADAGLKQIELETAKGNILDKQAVQERILAIASAQKALLKAKLVNELPPRILGMNVTAMSVEMEKVVGEVCSLMQKLEV